MISKLILSSFVLLSTLGFAQENHMEVRCNGTNWTVVGK